MKICTKCHKKKSRKRFYVNRTKSDGLQNICIPCRKALDGVRVQNGSEKARKQRAHQQMLLDEKLQKYDKKNHWVRLDRVLHPEKYQQRRERRRASIRLEQQGHYQRNKPQYIMRAKNRRAREKNAPGILTLVAVEARFALYGHRCGYCHGHAPLTIDHIKPLMRGGSNWPANITPACKPCNSGKQHRFLLPTLPYFPRLP